MRDRVLCANCDHWREEHYGLGGEWIGDRIPCSEYQGTLPNRDRLRQRRAELAQLPGARAGDELEDNGDEE